MYNRPCILILTAHTGGGHVSLAEALQQQLAHDATVEIRDPLPAIFHQHYRFVSRFALQLWLMEFSVTNTSTIALNMHRFFARNLKARLCELIDHIRPDLIISTYELLTYEVMSALETCSPHTPFVMLFSDPMRVHASWLTEKRATATLAPTQETYAQALTAGFAPESLHYVGWPVRSQFVHPSGPTREDVLDHLHLDPRRFIVFLQGGGEGAARLDRMVKYILASRFNIQIILAVGKNEALLSRFQGIKNLYALPFTRDIAHYMAAADVIMGKAGPNTIFESVMLGKPFLVTSYIPGQEKANLDFVKRYRLGWVALEPAQQGALLTQLATDPSMIEYMRGTVKLYREKTLRANQALLPVIHSLLPLPVD